MKHLQASLSTYQHRSSTYQSTDLPNFSSTNYIRAMKLNSKPILYYKVNLYRGSYELVYKPLDDIPLLTSPTTKFNHTSYHNTNPWGSAHEYIFKYFTDCSTPSSYSK